MHWAAWGKSCPATGIRNSRWPAHLWGPKALLSTGLPTALSPPSGWLAFDCGLGEIRFVNPPRVEPVAPRVVGRSARSPWREGTAPCQLGISPTTTVYCVASHSVSLGWRRSRWPIRRSADNPPRFSTRSAKSGSARLYSRRIWNLGSMRGCPVSSPGGIEREVLRGCSPVPRRHCCPSGRRISSPASHLRNHQSELDGMDNGWAKRGPMTGLSMWCLSA